MRRYSLRRRLIAAVLTLECGLVLGLSCATLLYLWREQMHGFDLMVRGRADSLLGQVHDAEDPNDSVAINLAALDLRGNDLWMARDEGGRTLAQSEGWSSEALSNFGGKQAPHDFRVRWACSAEAPATSAIPASPKNEPPWRASLTPSVSSATMSPGLSRIANSLISAVSAMPRKLPGCPGRPQPGPSRRRP